MTDDQPELRDRALVEREAIAWFTRMNGKPSTADRRDFDAWLAVSLHAEVFEAVCGLWSDLGVAAQQADGANTLAGPLEKIRLLRNKRRLRATGGAITGCLVLLLAGGWLWLERPYLMQDLGADMVSMRGERRDVTLADGSHVLLDAASAIDVTITPGQRRVRLLRGTAFFQVTHQASPFVVEAAGGTATVLGTEFDVSIRNDDQVTVTLAEGSIEVAVAGVAGSLVLKPGESVDYGSKGLGARRGVNVEDEMAWHGGRFIFTNARLADVMAQIERYRDGRIVVLGSSIGEQRVSGNISLENTDRALAAVRSSVGFRMTNLGRVVVIGP